MESILLGYNPSMRSKEALRALAEITAYQWGMVTSAQASIHGVSRLDVSRLAADGLLERVMHGVYKVTGTPTDELEYMRAAWLSTDPKRLAYERNENDPAAVVYAGASAARLHQISDLWDDYFDFITPVRRQSQRSNIRYRKRPINPANVTRVAGLLTLTIEATIADLVEVAGDLTLVAGGLRDAWLKGTINDAQLSSLLGPMADRGGFAKGDGAAILYRLSELAGIDRAGLLHYLDTSASPSGLAEVARQADKQESYRG